MTAAAAIAILLLIQQMMSFADIAEQNGERANSFLTRISRAAFTDRPR